MFTGDSDTNDLRPELPGKDVVASRKPSFLARWLERVQAESLLVMLICMGVAIATARLIFQEANRFFQSVATRMGFS